MGAVLSVGPIVLPISYLIEMDRKVFSKKGGSAKGRSRRSPAAVCMHVLSCAIQMMSKSHLF